MLLSETLILICEFFLASSQSALLEFPHFINENSRFIISDVIIKGSIALATDSSYCRRCMSRSLLLMK